jgi:hypothetical protein
LNDEERFIATNPPVPPTNTPAATTAPTTKSTTASGSNRTTILYPTTTTTPESVSIDNGGSSGTDQINDGQAAANGERSYSFYAIAETDLLIVVDNVVQWQQPLGAGQATGYLTGSSFVVSISGADSIVVLDGNGVENTYSGPQFTLP